MKVHLILDASHQVVSETLPDIAMYIPRLEKHARFLTFALHTKRSNLLDDIVLKKKTKNPKP